MGNYVVARYTRMKRWAATELELTFGERIANNSAAKWILFAAREREQTNAVPENERAARMLSCNKNNNRESYVNGQSIRETKNCSWRWRLRWISCGNAVCGSFDALRIIYRYAIYLNGQILIWKKKFFGCRCHVYYIALYSYNLSSIRHGRRANAFLIFPVFFRNFHTKLK